MKQLMWIVNSFLLTILLLSLAFKVTVDFTPHKIVKKKMLQEEEGDAENKVLNIKEIFKHDLFDTYVEKEDEALTKQSVSPIPQIKSITPTKPSESKKQEFISPLNVEIKGIAFSTNEEKSICMISDEAKKEKVYHVGEKIKDGQVIKICKNKILILRTNGQHETFLLKKENELTKNQGMNIEWKDVIKKINDENVEIDKEKFAWKFDSMESILESLNLFVCYKKGNPVGIKIGSIKEKNPLSIMGIQKKDIIVSVAGEKTGDRKARSKIIDKLLALRLEESTDILILRDGKDIKISCKLTKLEPSVDDKKEKDSGKKEDSLFKLSNLQEREKRVRSFSKRHKTERQREVVSELRNRILENMKANAQKVEIE
jgi:type II secretion system protein C